MVELEEETCDCQEERMKEEIREAEKKQTKSGEDEDRETYAS